MSGNDLIRRLERLPPDDLKRDVEFVCNQQPGTTWVDVVSIARASDADISCSGDPQTTAEAVVIRLD